MEQKVIVSSGATSGIGFEAIKKLLSEGHYVIAIGRNKEKIEKASQLLLESVPNAKFDFVCSDLSTINGVLKAVEDIKKYTDKIDVLLNVAGAISGWYIQTEEGIELQFATNHLGPYRLTYNLMPLLTEGARVINVTSESHRGAKIYFNDVCLKYNYHSLRAYKQSKLANVMFTLGLRQKFSNKVHALSFDPGLMSTEIGLKGGKPLEKAVWRFRMWQGKDPSVAGFHLAEMAVNDKYINSNDFYFRLGIPMRPTRRALEPESIQKIWQISAKMSGFNEDWSRA